MSTGEQGEMRSLRRILMEREPLTPEEQIDVVSWVKAYPDTELAVRLKERYSGLFEPVTSEGATG